MIALASLKKTLDAKAARSQRAAFFFLLPP
jgi:hypothetical protein